MPKQNDTSVSSARAVTGTLDSNLQKFSESFKSLQDGDSVMQVEEGKKVPDPLSHHPPDVFFGEMKDFVNLDGDQEDVLLSDGDSDEDIGDRPVGF